MRYLIDTGSCIAAMKRHPLVVQRLQSLRPDDMAISSVTLYELETGVAKCRDPAVERQRVDAFVAVMHLVDFDAAAARLAADIRSDLERRGRGIGPYDTLIAATALRHRLTMVSGNGSEFTRVANLAWEDWSIPIGTTSISLSNPSEVIASAWWSLAYREWSSGALTVGSPPHRVMEHWTTQPSHVIRLSNDAAVVAEAWARSLSAPVPWTITRLTGTAL
jgi:tRNA(fMet)-specific endonuclease VapC